MPLKETGLARAKYLLKYCDSESNELMIGVLHMCILPFAMFELGKAMGHPAGRSSPRWWVSDLGRPLQRHTLHEKDRRSNRIYYFNRYCRQLHVGRNDARFTLGLAAHLCHEHLEFVPSYE